MDSLKYLSRKLQVLLDFGVLTGSFVLANLLRFDFQIPENHLPFVVVQLPSYPLLGQRDLLELLATAEGLGTDPGSVLFVFRKLPDGRSARLSVPLHELLVLGDPRWNIRLEPGDVVSVPPEDAVSVSVVGSVKRPGVYKLPAGKGATLLRAIALAGGLGPRASKGIQVKRQGPSGEESMVKVDLGDIMSGKTSDFVLRKATWSS